MDAFIEIIEKLVESVSGQTWLEQNHFPFKFLKYPQAKVFDICLFESNAQGAYGFLWLEFHETESVYGTEAQSENFNILNNANTTTMLSKENESKSQQKLSPYKYTLEDLLIFPFSLARYKEDGDLISLTPWSLRNASSDNRFYEAWRTAQKQRNPLLTAKKGNFFHKKFTGEPSFIAMNIWGDSRNTCVRLDFQIAYKIFRTLERQYPQSIEVEFLSYLGSQSVFTNFAKLTSVFEYSSKMIPKSHVAIGMRYVPNNGVLFPRFVSLLHKARFPQKFKEQASVLSWQELLKYTESLGHLLGDFHKAMSIAPRNSDLAPEQYTKSLKEQWFNIVSQKLEERSAKVLLLQKYHTNYSGVFYLLPSYVSKIKESVANLDDMGIRIRSHGNIHLGQILIGMNDLVLLDYEADDFDEPKYRRLKQPCLKDFASMIISFRFAWHFTERKYYAQIADSPDNLEKDHNKVIYGKTNQLVLPDKYQPSLQELENTFAKFYKNSLDENVTSMQLRPKNPMKEKILFNFCFLMRVLKEIAREHPEGNPRPHLWLHILQDFIMQEGSI